VTPRSIGAVVNPATESEVDEVFELYARSFPPSYDEASAHLNFVREFEPPVPLENYLLVRGSEGELAGAVRVVERTMSLDGHPLRVAGLSYYAVAPAFQNTECGVRIVKALFQHVGRRGYDLILGIARKVMDGYWSRFGFFGLSGFYSISVDCHELTRLTRAGAAELRRGEGRDLETIKALYGESYGMVSGAMVRDDALWGWWLAKIDRRTDLELYLVECAAVRCGYLVLRADTIVEIAAKASQLPAVLSAASRLCGDRMLTFSLSPTHPVWRFLRSVNYTASTRRVWNGGHVARVTDWRNLLSRVSSVIERRAATLGLAPFQIPVNSLVVEWDGSVLSFREGAPSADDDHVSFAESDWQKVLLGVEPLDTIQSFRGGVGQHIISLLFPELWPQISELDEF
jgi:predicted N-acetyltransferase YhbS